MASLLAAWASWLRGGRYVYSEGDEADAEGDQVVRDRSRRPADDGRRADTEVEAVTIARNTARQPATEVLRIGEVAKLTGLTTRTLRYWEELGLIRPSGYRGGGERLYSPTDMARVTRIRDLQELLGFSLAEVRVVLETEDVDVLDRLRSEYRWGDADPAPSDASCWTRPSRPTTAPDRPTRRHPGPDQCVPGRAGGQGRSGCAEARRRRRLDDCH